MRVRITTIGKLGRVLLWHLCHDWQKSPVTSLAYGRKIKMRSCR
jgi:hypothetical protein